MRRARLGLALAGMAVCTIACALMWPHARNSAAILIAQDDPAELSDLQIDAILRNNDSTVATNI
jgi:hypothetical protein